MVRTLERDGFEKFGDVVTPSGIYCLLNGGEVVYVGQSKNVYSRISWHKNACQRKKTKGGSMFYYGSHLAIEPFDFDEVWVHWCPCGRLDLLEREYINKYKPTKNVNIKDIPNHPPVDIVSLARKAGVEGIEKRRKTFA